MGATASDPVDGDISNSFVVSGDIVNLLIIGDYTMTYTVRNSRGVISTITRTVNVIAQS